MSFWSSQYLRFLQQKKSDKREFSDDLSGTVFSRIEHKLVCVIVKVGSSNGRVEKLMVGLTGNLIGTIHGVN